MTYYNTTKILEIMKNYSQYRKAIQCFKREYSSVGVAMYGIEATMPRGNTITMQVENEAIRQVESVKVFADMATDMKYLDDRLDRVDENDKHILQMRLDGYDVTNIALIEQCSKSTIHRTLNRTARAIERRT